jgi:hypothetical protein
MGKRLLRVVFAGALGAASAASLALASSATPVFEIPGMRANRIEVGGVTRLDDGGAVLAAALGGGAREAAWKPVAVRLNLDGTVDLAYGSDGISTPRLGNDVRATSLAVDPANGDSWIGLAAGSSARSEILALDGRGRRRSGFGHGGVLELGAGMMGGPVALASRGGRLLVAAGTSPCSGCAIGLLDAATGRTVQTARLAPAYSTGCAITAVTSASFLSAHRAILGTENPGTGHCTADLVTLDTSALRETNRPTGPGAADQAVVSGTCAAESNRTVTRLGALSAQPSPAAGGHVISVSPLGGASCAALIERPGRRGAFVLQASPGQVRASSDAVPAGVAPLGMFRCHQHLLVIGDRRRGRQRAAVVAVVPVREGPEALAAGVAGSGRCTT